MRPRRLQPRRILLLLGLLSMFTVDSAAARTMIERQPLAGIRDAVETFVRTELDGPGRLDDVQIHRLDSRLRLARCEVPLSVWKPRGYTSAGRLTLGVRCAAPVWKLYVPVRLERRLKVVTTTRPIATGATLEADDLELRGQNVASLRDDYFTSVEDLIGQKARQSMRAGAVPGQRNVRHADLITRGQKLIIEATDGSVGVRMQGEALQNGREGQRIRVRNLSSQRVIEARVVGRDRVRVTF